MGNPGETPEEIPSGTSIVLLVGTAKEIADENFRGIFDGALRKYAVVILKRLTVKLLEETLAELLEEFPMKLRKELVE